MAGGQKFQYDESGSTFFYFLLSFLFLVLIPVTYYYWPRKRIEDPDKEEKQCKCEQCSRKRELLKSAQPMQGLKDFLIKLSIVFGWIVLLLIAYKVSQFDYEMANFDPYEILKVPAGATQADIKKAYRKLSVILHPDKETGNEKEFMKLSKAYQALTDDEARKNWEKYGNPDGPGAMSFGIALPSWIVEKENSIWVLGVYALIFMIALPFVVGTWWYRSMKFSGDKVLVDSNQMFFYYFDKTPHMMVKRIIMILAGSYEFDKKHNPEMELRLSDAKAVNQLLKKLPNVSGVANKEIPLCLPYSIKARAIIHAHLLRLPLDPVFEEDRKRIIEKCPYLIQGQINCVCQLIFLAYSRRVQNLPSIETIENCMKLSAMIIQGMLEFKSPFLQLPHIEDDHLKLFVHKKRPVRSLQQFAQLKGDERRHILRFLYHKEYYNVMRALGSMPYIKFDVSCEVMDDEDSSEVTAGAIVTVTVTLERSDMSTIFGDENAVENNDLEYLDHKNNQDNSDLSDSQPKRRPHWRKTRKQHNQEKKSPKQPIDTSTTKITSNKTKTKEVKDSSDSSDNTTDGSSDETDSSDSSCNKEKSTSIADDDKEWEKFQQKLNKRQKAFDAQSKLSHSVVHCPYFPAEKQEYWWAYVCDRKSRTLLTPPLYITSLKDKEDYQLRFSAPSWKGVFTLTVCLRSDSYIGFDQQKDIKLDVKEAPAEISEHPQWDFENSEDENLVESNEDESEYTTDEDVPDS